MAPVVVRQRLLGASPLLLVFVVFLTGGATSLNAQTAGAARIQAGPLGLTPRVALRNVGVDRNVFNAAGMPQQDVTFAVVPSAEALVRVRRARLSSRTTIEWNYFQKAASQRSVNVSQDGRVEVDLIRFVPFATAMYVRTRQRPNFEIDERVAQIRTALSVGGQVPVGSRVRIDIETRREHTDLGTSKFGNAALAQALNGTSTEGIITGRFEITALTTAIVKTTIRHDRFEFSPLRDSDSLLVSSGVEFKPAGLISGQAFFGLQRFTTLSADVPDRVGTFASVDVRYAARDTTKIGTHINRDVGYSIEPGQPYFVTTGADVEVTQSLGPTWVVSARVGRTVLAYRDVVPAPGAAVLAPRRDRVILFGVAASRRIGTLVRVGVDADWSKRNSVQAARVYNGFKMGGFLTYGY